MSLGKHTLDILEETSLMRTKPVETHMDPSVKLSVDQDEFLPDPDNYQRLVRKLNYLTIKCPDIFISISVCDQSIVVCSSLDSHEGNFEDCEVSQNTS